MKALLNLKILLIAFVLSLSISITNAQKIYTLGEIIKIAQQQSSLANQAKNKKENIFWRYKTHLANYKPQLALQGTLPNFNRSIQSNLNDDGSIGFIDVSNLNTNLSLSLSQSIGLTGGEVFINSSLDRLQNLSGNFSGVQYASTPLRIGFVQPLFGFNELRWNNRIEPLILEESLKEYNEDFENIALECTKLFFNLLIAQETFEIEQKNQANNNTLYQIGQKRYSLGNITENDLLQLEINVINASQNATQAKLTIETGQLELKTFMGIGDNQPLKLMVPSEIPNFTIAPELAIEKAKANRKAYINYSRQRLEAQREVAQAKGNSSLNVNVIGSFGLTQTANNFTDVYANPRDQQALQIDFEIPLLDWGKQKASIRTALANEELINNQLNQEESRFIQEVFVSAKQFETYKLQLKTAEKLDEIAQRRYNIALQRYIDSSISITDLNIALNAKDTAKQSYLNALFDFWQAYYQIRALTLYDFENNIQIQYD